jgi:PAS domain S-box-containing protein
MQGEGIAYANQAYAEIVGFSVSELLEFSPTQIWGMIHQEDRDRLRERFRKYMATDEVAERTEYRITRKDGQVRWVESFVSITDYKGQPAMQTVLVDITERRKAEEAILKSEVKYRTLAEQSLQGLTILQDDGLVYTNRAFAKIVGRRIDELLGMSLTEIYSLFHPDDQKALRQRILDRLAGREAPSRSEYRVIRSDGEVRWVETYASSIEYAGASAIQTVLVDVTDRKLVERELRSAKDRALLYMDLMGHDIRNQLQVIMGSASLLYSATDESVKDSFLDVIKKSVQRCSRMIEEVKETEHLMAVPVQEKSLVKALDTCVDAISSRIEDVEFHRSYKIAEAIIEADNYLELLLSNILMNAIEHNNSSEKEIWITLSEDPEEFMVSIADNGPGIPDSMKIDLFDMSRRFGGLGLHQSKQILDKYDGRIEVLDRSFEYFSEKSINNQEDHFGNIKLNQLLLIL